MAPIQRRIAARPLGVLLAATALTLLSACKTETPAPPPPEVGVIKLEQRRVPLDLVYTARTRGEREVEVRARVSGILKKRFYQQGSEVAAGALLFQIDPAPFVATVRSAEGRLGIERARLTEAKQQLERAQKLFEIGASAGQAREAAEAAEASARASVQSAQADVDSARLDLTYTEVRAPIGGITGREARSEGSLINAGDDSSLLTTIAQSSQLYVDFTMPEAEARHVRAALAATPDAVRVRLRPANGTELETGAKIEFIDSRVQADTGTVEVRATLANTSSTLAPGQFVRARVDGLQSEVGIYVPARAVLYGADGPFVWKLDAQNIVKFQPLKLGDGHGNLLRVNEGLAAGDRIIVDGVLKVQPEAPVQPVEQALEATPAAVALP